MDALGHQSLCGKGRSLLSGSLNRSLKLSFALLTGFLLSSCQLTYLLKGAYNQAEILYHRKPILSLLQKKEVDEKTRAKLELALAVHSFAEKELSLKVGSNYTSFVDLKRPYVVWAVNAAPQWELEHFLWSFPIVGSVPYKGFPKEEDAKEEADQLKNKGYDTFIRGVRAYSTLGWLSDPVLSSMLNYDDHDLANTIIHESTHATVYIKNNADFNERLATFVGDKGTEIFYLKKEGPNSPILKLIQAEASDQALFSQFIAEELKQLRDFYRQLKTRDLALRQKEFDKIKTHFEEKVRPQLRSDLYENFQKVPLNNARLLLFRTYVEDLSDFEKLFQKSGNSMKVFLERIKTLEGDPNPVEGLKKLI